MFFVLAVVGLPGITRTAVCGDDAVANVIIFPNEIEWRPHVYCNALVLTVSGPGDSYFEKTFPAGTNPVFELLDNKGVPFPDGPCTYELRVIADLTPNLISSPAEGRMPQGDPATGKLDKEDKQLDQAFSQSGHFFVSGGEVVTGGIPEEDKKFPEAFSTRNPDIVHADDVIIDGSLAVGSDAYSGYDFGFDTIVLMENNLRILFDDTSSIQNYPRNDWRILLNDSNDGGGNYFAVQDVTNDSYIFKLEAGAPNNSLYVDSHGDVGINTSTPYYELHIVDGDSPAIRLEQDGSYGWTPQKWDLCGNESNFFIRDATHASKLPFRIEPNAPTNSIFINDDGKIGIGTGSPSGAMELERTGENVLFVVNRTDGARCGFLAKTNQFFVGTTTSHPVVIAAGNSWVTKFNTDGTLNMSDGGSYTGTWNDASSREYKENIETLSAEEALEAFEGLNPVKYNYKKQKQEARLGFIAEDVPDLVAMKDRKNLSTMDLMAVLTKVTQEQQKLLQEQQKISEEQRRVIQTQQETIAELNKRVSDLEKCSR